MRFQSLHRVSELLDALERTPEDPGDLGSMLQHIAQTARTFFGTDVCVIFAVNPITGRFITSLTIAGDLLVREVPFEHPRPWGLTQQVLEQGILLIEDLEKESEYHSTFTRSEGIRSFAALALQMRTRHKPLGVLYLDFRQPRQFSSSDQELLQLFAERASFLLQEAWLLQRYQEVARIGKEINHELATVDVLFQRLPEQIAAILDASYALLLAVYQPQTGTLDVYAEEEGRPLLLKNDPLEGACKYVLETQQTLFIQQLSEEADRLPFQYVSIKETGPVESLIFAPLVFRDVPLGALSIQHPEPDAYDHEDLAILQLLANHIALALHNIRLYDDLRRLNETGQLLTQQLDAEQTLQATVEKIREATQADVVILYPYQSMQQRFLLPPRVSGDLYTSHPQFLSPSKPDGITTLALRYVEPIFAKDGVSLYTVLQGETRQGNFGQSEKIRSAAVMPLRVGEESVGVLFVNFRQPQSFKSPQRLLIEGLAHYAAIAIKNAQAFGTLIQRRIHELEILQHIDRELTRTLELKPVLNTLLRLANEHVPAEEGSILLYDPKTQVLETAAAIGPHAEASRMQKIPLQGSRGITRWVLEHKRPVRVDNVRRTQPWRDLHLQVASDTTSELDVPLLDGGEVVGILNFESVRENAFSQEDQDFLVTLSGQAILAIKNAQAFERERRLVEETQVLNEISKEINSHLDPDYVFNLILEKALEVTNSTRGNLMIYDPEQDDLWMAAERGVVGEKIGMRQSREQGVVGYVAKHKQLLNVDLTQPPWRDVNLDLIPGTRSELAVPMLAGDDLRGVLNIESFSSNYFIERDERLLVALADLAVIALQNAQAYKRETWLVEEARVLNEISKELTSQLDPNHVFDLILENALKLTESTMGNLMLFDPDRNDLWMAAERGVAREKKGQRQSLDEGIVGYVARTKQLLNVDLSQHPWNEIYVPFIPGAYSELAVPLLSGNEFHGVLNIESTSRGSFSESHVRLLQELADLAVIALHNAGAYEREKHLVEEARVLNEISKELTRQFEPNHAFELMLSKALELTNSTLGSLHLYDPDTGYLRMVADRGVAEEKKGIRQSLDEGIVGYVAKHQQMLNIPDVSQPPWNKLFLEFFPGTRSELAIPMLERNNLRGVLNVESPFLRHFGESDMRLLQGLADLAVVALQNAEMAQERQEFEQRANSVEEMSSIGQSAYEVTHRLGNDLGLVDFYIRNIRSELANQGLTNSQVSENLDNIRQSVQRVLSFSRDLKSELAKLSEERALSEPVLIAPKDLFEKVIAVSTLPPRIQIELEVDEGVKNVRVIFGQVDDILRNLVVNAMQAMPPEGGKITLRARNAGRAVALEVADTGVGISQEKQPQIFDLFFSTKGSSGFGLWSARRIALKNQGDLKVESMLGQGTTFTLLLPVADKEIP